MALKLFGTKYFCNNVTPQRDVYLFPGEIIYVYILHVENVIQFNFCCIFSIKSFAIDIDLIDMFLSCLECSDAANK